MRRQARLSACGLYRYDLSRSWDEAGLHLGFLMLNPSTADAEIDDPTIRRCIAFAKREGYGGLVVRNLHAYRATRPEELKHVSDRDGPENSQAIRDMATASAACGTPVVCAWGATGDLFGGATRALKVIRAEGARTVCLGSVANGMPRHPLYVPGDQPLEPYDWSA